MASKLQNRSNAVANKEYIEELQRAIRQAYGVDSKFIDTILVAEILPGTTAWEGGVEIFELFKHPQTRWCYAWVSKDGTEEKITTVLQVPPVISPATAVRANILKEQKQSQK